MPVVHDINRLLQRSQANADRHEDDHIQQSIAVIRRIIALEQLRTDHQPTGGQHDPHGYGYASLAGVLAVQLYPYTILSATIESHGRRVFNLHVLWTG